MRTSILDDAAAIVDGDRERTYGDPGANLRAIANLWDSWLLARGWSGPGMQVDDVALMMALLKIARLARSPDHRDSLVDLAGYARLLDRCHQDAHPASQGDSTPPPPGGGGAAGGAGAHSPISPPPARTDFQTLTSNSYGAFTLRPSQGARDV